MATDVRFSPSRLARRPGADDTCRVSFSTSATSPRRRLGLAIAALAGAAVVALPAPALAAPTAGASKSGGTAAYVGGKGEVTKAGKRKRHSRTHRAGKKLPTRQVKPPAATLETSKPQGGGTGGSGSGNGSATPSAPSAGKPPRGTTKPPATATPPTTPPPTTPTTPPSLPTTPPPSTTTPPPSSELLFSGSRIRDFAMTQAAPNAITEVPDPLGSGETVLKMTVNDQDVAPITPTENPRAQAISPDIINQGQEFWLATKFLLPADFPSSIPGWMSLVSVYGAPYNGPSPWCIGIAGSNLAWDRNASYNWDTPWKTPMVRGQWTTLLVHERFAGDGFIEMWVNGTPVTFFAPGSSYNPSRQPATQHLAMKTVDFTNGGGVNSVRIAQYRQKGMFQTASVYWGAVKVGTTRAAVGG